MGEKFSGRSFERYSGKEKDPLLKAKETVAKIDRLMAKLIELGGELSSAQKQNIRTQVQNLLSSLGLSNMRDFAIFTVRINQGIRERLTNPKVPTNYPSIEVFERNFNLLLEKSVPSNLPVVPRDVLATEVARYGQSDWNSIQGRTSTTLDYHYCLGRVLCDELVYSEMFEKGDEIKIKDSWQVDNGRHRTLSLRTLGERFTKTVGLDSWVKVERMND